MKLAGITLFTLFAVLITSSLTPGVEAEVDEGAITGALKGASDITNNLVTHNAAAYEAFQKSLKNSKAFMKAIGPFLGVMGPILDVILAFIPTTDQTLKAIKDGFNKVHVKLDEISFQVEDLDAKVDWNPYRHKLETHIEQVDIFHKQMKDMSNSGDIPDAKQKFLNAYYGHWSHRGLELLNWITSNPQWGDGALQTYIKYSRNDKYKVLGLMQVVMSKLINCAEIEMAVLGLEKSADYDKVKGDWEGYIDQAQEAMKAAAESITLDKAETDIDRIKNSDGTKSGFEQKVYDSLLGKWQWADWFVFSWYKDAASWSKERWNCQTPNKNGGCWFKDFRNGDRDCKLMVCYSTKHVQNSWSTHEANGKMDDYDYQIKHGRGCSNSNVMQSAIDDVSTRFTLEFCRVAMEAKKGRWIKTTREGMRAKKTFKSCNGRSDVGMSMFGVGYAPY